MNTEIHTLIGAYALDAVDDLERAAFDRHLRECEDCRTEVAELRETTTRLADATWSVPPPRLRENVLAEVAQTRQLAPATPAGKPQQRPVAARWRLTAAAAAVVVAAAGAGTVVYTVQDQRVREVRSIAAAAQANEARIRAVLAAPDLVMREGALSGGGRVTVAESRLNNAGVLVLAADAAPAAGRVYQLWTLQGNTPVSVGALEPGQTGALRLVDGLPAATGVGVTVEPAGGSAAPTTPLVAQVQL